MGIPEYQVLRWLVEQSDRKGGEMRFVQCKKEC